MSPAATNRAGASRTAAALPAARGADATAATAAAATAATAPTAARRAPAGGAEHAARFHPVRAARAFDEIAAQVRAEVAEGRLRIGARLPAERVLAEEFGVSRNTLREALRSLEHAGLIRLQKGASGGAFIRESSGDAIVTGMLDMYHLGGIQPAQLTEARIWFESIAIRAACERATAADIDALNANIDAAEKARSDGDFAARAAIHLDFHRILARASGNPIMVVVMEGILDVLALFVQSIGNYDNAFVFPSRRRFMKHLAARDADAAVAEMESCLKRLQRTYLSRVGKKLAGEKRVSEKRVSEKRVSEKRPGEKPRQPGAA